MNNRQVLIVSGLSAATLFSLGLGVVPQPCPITQSLFISSRDAAANLRAGMSWDYVKSIYFTEFNACEINPIGDTSHCPNDYVNRCDSAMDSWRAAVRDPGGSFTQEVLAAAPTCQGDYYFTGQSFDADDQWCYGSTDGQYVFSSVQSVYLCFKQFGTPAHPASFNWIVNHASSTSVSTVYMDPRDNFMGACISWFDITFGIRHDGTRVPYHEPPGEVCGDFYFWYPYVEKRASARNFRGRIDRPMWLVNNDPASGPVRIGTDQF